jgi:streptomycin 6-kinase
MPISMAERLARAVLLFHSGEPWTTERRATWISLTGSDEATTRVLCNLARAVHSDEVQNTTEEKSS